MKKALVLIAIVAAVVVVIVLASGGNGKQEAASGAAETDARSGARRYTVSYEELAGRIAGIDNPMGMKMAVRQYKTWSLSGEGVVASVQAGPEGTHVVEIDIGGDGVVEVTGTMSEEPPAEGQQVQFRGRIGQIEPQDPVFVTLSRLKVTTGAED
jgi:ABC-type antimicrobial peptide transport system permease subunit